MNIIPVIIDQHVEEASFLWILRRNAVNQPHYTLKDLARLDERVEAHLDGLRIAGNAIWDLIVTEMERGEPGELFVGSVLAFESSDAVRISKVIEALEAAPENAAAMISALGWLSLESARPHILRLTESQIPLQRRIGLRAAAVHRWDPGKIASLLQSDGDVAATAIRLAGELGLADPAAFETLFRSADDDVRHWSAWAFGLQTSSAGILDVLRAELGMPAPRSMRAAEILFRRLSPKESSLLRQRLASSPATLRVAVQASGPIGDPRAIPWLVEQMSDPLIARVAGESFSMITGVDIAYEDLEGKKPEGIEPGPTEDPNDENIEMDPDENLPWPDPIKIGDWWRAHAKEFRSGARYLVGQPINARNLALVLKNGRQRQRAAAAIELAMMNRGDPLFEVRAPGFRQRRALGV